MRQVGVTAHNYKFVHSEVFELERIKDIRLMLFERIILQQKFSGCEDCEF